MTKYLRSKCGLISYYEDYLDSFYCKLQADADGNGIIDYDEFITATMHMNRMNREEHVYTAFQYFDKDNSG